MLNLGMYSLFQRAFTYYCTPNGTIICLNGWKEPTIGNSNDEPHLPCSESICQLECIHGKCTAPDVCSSTLPMNTFQLTNRL